MTYHIAMPPEEDSAAAISKVHKNLVKNTRVVPEIIMLTDRQTDRHNHHNTPRSYCGGVIMLTLYIIRERNTLFRDNIN